MEQKVQTAELQLEQIFRRILRKMGSYGKYVDLHFSGSQAAALDVIHEHGPLKVTELADRLSLSMSAVTLLCDKLFEHELVERKRSEDDRRTVSLELTLQGESMLNDIREVEKTVVCQWLSGIPKGELEQFNRTFQHIMNNVKSARQ